MESDFNGNEEEDDNNNIDSIKEIRKQLEARIETQKLTQQQRIDSLQTLVPDLVSSLHLSLKVVSAFNNTHYPPLTPTPNPPSPSPQNPNPPEISENPSSKKRLLEPQSTTNSNSSYKKTNTSPKHQYPSSELTQDSPESSFIGDDEILPRSMSMPMPMPMQNGNVGIRGVSQRPMPPMFPAMGSPGSTMFSQFSPFRPPMRRNSMGSFDFASPKPASEEDDMRDLEELLSKKSFRERQNSDTVEQLLDLINRPTAMETAKAAKFKSKGGSQVKEYCSALTKEDCRRQSRSYVACDKVHFRRIIAQHTDVTLGNCGFLDGCHHMKTCRKVHYELDNTQDVPMMMGAETRAPPKPIKQSPEYCSEIELGEPQWINCDIRTFRMDILGQFGVIMADPPWDIHMKLPYGTMADDEMKELNVPTLQTDGLIFLWVTGRAIELGRDCLELWGYKCVEELIWVKTDQLQQIIRTGRTGHWLNHSKEHCLVGIKGNPEVNRNIDTNVIVAAVRETSRKPDEMYSLLERLSPRTRKLELFARVHNTHAGWISLGNQLEGVRLVDEGLRARFKAAYPDVEVEPPSPRRTAIDIDSSTAQTRSPFMDIGSKATPVQFKEPVASVPYPSGEKTNGCQDVSVV